MSSRYYFERARCIEVTPDGTVTDHGIVRIRFSLPRIDLSTGDLDNLSLGPVMQLQRADGKALRVPHEKLNTEDGDSYVELPITSDSGSKIYLGETAVEILSSSTLHDPDTPEPTL